VPQQQKRPGVGGAGSTSKRARWVEDDEGTVSRDHGEVEREEAEDISEAGGHGEVGSEVSEGDTVESSEKREKIFFLIIGLKLILGSYRILRYKSRV
jgi:hypothetical protein